MGFTLTSDVRQQGFLQVYKQHKEDEGKCGPIGLWGVEHGDRGYKKARGIQCLLCLHLHMSDLLSEIPGPKPVGKSRARKNYSWCRRIRLGNIPKNETFFYTSPWMGCTHDCLGRWLLSLWGQFWSSLKGDINQMIRGGRCFMGTGRNKVSLLSSKRAGKRTQEPLIPGKVSGQKPVICFQTHEGKQVIWSSQ